MIFFKKLGESIGYSDYNALVYLLRKFKKLKTTLQIGAYELTSDFGDFKFSKGFENIGNNFILNNDVTVSSENVLKNTFYTFIFTILDVNLSGVVNKRTIKLTGDTGEYGELNLNIEKDLIGDNEVIMPNFDVEIVFDEHEYYTPISDVEINLFCDKRYIKSNENATIEIHARKGGIPLPDLTLFIYVNGRRYMRNTNNQGIITLTYNGTGNNGLVTVDVADKSIYFYDYDNVTEAVFSGNSVKLGSEIFSSRWLQSNGDVFIDWGDGLKTTVNNPTKGISHNYSDGSSNHTVLLIGDIVSLGDYCFFECSNLNSINVSSGVKSLGDGCFSDCTNLSSVNIPESVESFGDDCFAHCDILPSIKIPSSVRDIGEKCFQWCWALDDFQLYWESNPFPYDFDKIPYGVNTIFTIPDGTKQIYVDAGYPIEMLVERKHPSIVSQLPTPIMNVFNQAENGTYYLYWDLSGVNGALNNIPATIIDNVLKLSEEVGIFLFYDVLSTDDIENDTPIIPVFPRWSGYDLTLANTHELFETWVLNMSECYERYSSSIPVLFYDMPYPSFEEGAMRKDGKIGVGMSKPLTEDEYNAIKKSSDPPYVDFTGKFKLGVFDIANDSPNFIII